MNQQVSVINIEERIGKTVGRRRPHRDTLLSSDSLQNSLNEMIGAYGHRYGRRGVFRFKTHTEANEWTRAHTKPKKI